MCELGDVCRSTRNMFNINCGGASTEAEKRAEKGRGRSKGGKEDKKEGKDYKEGEKIKLQYLNSTHHGGVEFTYHFTSPACSTKKWWSKLDISRPELSVCVCDIARHRCVTTRPKGQVTRPPT